MSYSDLQAKLSQQVRVQKETVDEYQAPNEKPVYKVTARRVIAFIIDILTLFAIGALITMIGGRYLFFIGDNGWWIGIAISALYFGFFDSAAGGGRTFGKRLAGIEVIKIDGTQIGFIDAVLRYSPFAVITAVLFFSGKANALSPVTGILGLIATLLGLGIVIFGITHPQRRSMHDLLLDTIVIKNDTIFAYRDIPIRSPMITFLIIGFIIAGAEAGLRTYLVFSQEGQKLSMLNEKLISRKDIQNPQVGIFYTFGENLKLRKALVIKAFIPGGVRKVVQFSDGKRISDSIKLYLSNTSYVPGDTKDVLIELRHGYTIGIGGTMYRMQFRYPYSRQLRMTTQKQHEPRIKRFKGGKRARDDIQKKLEQQKENHKK